MGFSFTYEGKRFYFDTDGEHKIDENLTVYAECRDFDEYGAFYRVIWFENKGKNNTGIISDINDFDATLPLEYAKTRSGYMPTDKNVCITSMQGAIDGFNYHWSNKKSATEFSFSRDYLYEEIKERSYRNVGGRSSDGTMPFFDLGANGKGVMLAIGWTGSWKADFALCDGGVSVKTGLATKTQFYLTAGEKVRTSSILVMNYDKGEDKSNKFRSLIKKHFSHVACTKAAREGLYANELWGGLPSEEMKKRISEIKAHGIAFEDLWIDAGWYGQCEKCDEAFSGDWFEYTGEWEINKRVHPQGLIDVKDTANDAGINMMLWLEPERATRKVEMPKKHPDWFMGDSERDYIINYGNEGAWQYIFDTLSFYIEKLEMSCYRQDYNIPYLTEFAEKNDTENRHGITEIKHIMGLYRLFDALHERFPELLIDNCASGGRRIDIEMLCRSIAFFRSDYQCEFNPCAEVLQTHNSNISKILPLAGCTTKCIDDIYDLRSAYSTSFGCAYYNAIFQSMDDEKWELAKRVNDEYLAIRKYLSCDFYNHGSSTLDMTSWAMWQYHDKVSGKGIVMAFRRPESPFEGVKISLCGVAGAMIEYKNLDTGDSFAGMGELEITLPKKRSSVIFEYEIK